MPVIPINDIAPWTQEVATAGQTVFDTNWTADALTDVVVYSRLSSAIDADDATQIVSTADYVASFVLPNSYVRITFIPGKERTLNSIVTIMRNTPADRLNMYINTNFQPTMLNGDFNRLLMMIQQRLLTDNQLAVKYNNSDTLNVPPGVKYIADNLLPRLPPLHGWMKNADNTAIIAAPFGGGTGGTSTSVTVIINQPAHGFAVNDVVYNNAGVYMLADAISASEAEVVGMVTAVASASDFSLLVIGYVTTLTGLTPGGVYFLDNINPGELTLVEPDAIGSVSKPLFIATSATTGFFFNMRGKVIEAPGSGTSLLVITQPGHGFTVEQVVYLNNGTYTLAKADTVPTSAAIGIVTTVVDVDSFVVTQSGYETSFAGKTPGAIYYLSEVTAGLLTTTQPTGAGFVIKPMFIAATATAGWVLETMGTVIPAALTNGQLFIGSTGLPPVAASLTAGANITITPGAGSITIAATAATVTWSDVTGATQAMAVANGYITNRGAGVTYTLPATASLGDQISVVGKLGLTTIAQNANQQILISSSSSTVGVGGSVTGTNVGDCIKLVCITAGASTVWRASDVVGNWTIV